MKSLALTSTSVEDSFNIAVLSIREIPSRVGIAHHYQIWWAMPTLLNLP